MAIGAAGIGAGADWNTVISQLLQIESRPLLQLQTRESEINQQISDFGKVKSAFSTFQSALSDLRTSTGLAPNTASSSSESVLTATADSSATAGSYDLLVGQLASSDKFASSVYADSDTAVGTGTLSIEVNGSTMNITVDGSNNTLTGLMNAINGDSSNPGVTASIINVDGGSRLILAGDETGAANAINISFVDDDLNNTDENGLSKLFYIGVGGDGYAEQIDTAADSQLTIDGFDVTGTTNSISGVVTGVTFQLVDTGSSTVTVSRDTSKVEENAQAFVDAYNTLRSTLDGMSASSLANDTGLRRMEDGLVAILNTAATIDGSDVYLFEAGIERDQYGVLSLDTSTLTQALNDDFDKIVSLFSDSTQGYANRLDDYLDSLLETNGVIDSRQDGLNSRLDLIQEQIERQELRLDTVEKQLVKEFAALDQTIALLQSTSSYLTSQLSVLSK